VDGDSDVTAQVLSALLVLVLLAAAVGAVIRGRTLAQRVESRPDGRVWLYRNFVLRMWPLMVLPPLVAWASSRLTTADLGWAWPHGVGAYLLAAYYLVVLTIASFRVRGRMRRGVVFARRQRVAFMIPRTARERWWVVALSLTAGITEEALFRGALLAVGVKIYHLPYLVAALAAVVIFAVGHLYQGWTGLVGSALVGSIFAVLYALSGSLLLPILVHASQDLISLHLIPAASTPQPPTPPATTSTPETLEPSGTTAPTSTIPRPAFPDGPPTVRAAVPD
jgi:membrane protease YdiL (CAAX protease family)